MDLRKNKAFTLIEVVCSVAFLIGGFLIAAHLMNQIIAYSLKTKRLLEGVNNAVCLLETGTMGAYNRDNSLYGLQIRSFSNKYNISLKKTVVSWKEQRNVHEIMFLTYKGWSSYER
jgi:hypothetical protein